MSALPPGPADPAPWLRPGALRIAGWILASHRRVFDRPLLAGPGGERTPQQNAQELFVAALVVLAHDGGDDPRLIYANAAALRLWRRPLAQMLGMPSRLTAEPEQRRDRAAALLRARQQEAVVGYGGTRIDSDGRRFRIEGARLWTLRDEEGRSQGQAAAFARWWWL